MADDDKPAKGDDDKKDDGALGDAGKRALAAERDARRKAENDLKAARDELATVKADQDSSKSDLQKVLDKVAGLETRAEAAERAALVAQVASEKGLTPSQAKRLQGDTRAELETDAEELLEAFGNKGDKGDGDDGDDGKGDKGDGDGGKPAGGKPREKLRPGAANDDDASKEVTREEADKLAASIESGGF
jgi:hypothetical protein